MRVLLAVVLLSACGAAGLPEALPPARALCFARAELRAESRANAECSLDAPFAACPAHEDIMAEFRAAQEACR